MFVSYRTIEYMSPEVMDLQRVSSDADMWGVGCITFQLLSGGISPFFAHSRYRTMAKVLDCDYSLEQAELSKTSPEAKDFISMLLIKVSGCEALYLIPNFCIMKAYNRVVYD